MTRNEAVEIVENYIESFEGGASIYESLKMAADALKNEAALLDKVLEIIDSNYPDPNAVYSFSEYEAADVEGQEKALDRIKDVVLELKGGEQE